MGAAFDPSLSSLKDKARLALGDIAAPFLLEDETYSAVIRDTGAGELTDDVKVELARALSARCNNLAVEVAEADERRRYGDRVKFYNELAATLTRIDDDGGNSVGLAVGGQIPAPCIDHIHRMNRLNGIGRRFPFGRY